MQILGNNNYYSNNLSFGKLTKAKLTPFKRAFCEMYHPPLEKMNKVDDLLIWVSNKYKEVLKPHEMFGIEEVLVPWKKCVEEKLDLARHRNSIFWKFLILKNIKDLNSTYIFEPKVDVIVKTIEDIKESIKQGSQKFNFYRQYENHLRENALKKYFKNGEEKNGWIEFSYNDDAQKQAETTEDIRALSTGTKWCTKGSLYSGLAVESQDDKFYIYVENGKTKYAVRTERNYTQEIRDTHNDATYLPEELFESLKKINGEIKYWDNNSSLLDAI